MLSYIRYSHHSLKTLTNKKPRRAGVHTLPYIHIHTHTEVTSRSLIFEQFWLPILIVSLCSIPNIYIQVLQGIISQSKLKDKVDWFTVIILKYRYQERKHFFWGMYIWISNNYWFSITGQCWLSGFKFDFISIWKTKLNAIIKLFKSITSLSDKRIIHFCPLLTLLPDDESVPLDSFVGMRSLM